MEKPHTILKCITCSTLESSGEFLTRKLHPKRANKEILVEKISIHRNSAAFEEINKTVEYKIKLENNSNNKNNDPNFVFDYVYKNDYKNIIIKK